MRIIYETSDGGVAVIVPAPEYLLTHTMLQTSMDNATSAEELKTLLPEQSLHGLPRFI